MAEDEKSNKGFHLFGRNLASIRCLRTSLMTGIIGGITTGLGFFLFTSRVRRATNVGFGGFLGMTMTAWVICRTRLPPELDPEMVREALKAKILMEGTELEEQMQLETQTKDV